MGRVLVHDPKLDVPESVWKDAYARARDGKMNPVFISNGHFLDSLKGSARGEVYGFPASDGRLDAAALLSGSHNPFEDPDAGCLTFVPTAPDLVFDFPHVGGLCTCQAYLDLNACCHVVYLAVFKRDIPWDTSVLRVTRAKRGCPFDKLRPLEIRRKGRVGGIPAAQNVDLNAYPKDIQIPIDQLRVGDFVLYRETKTRVIKVHLAQVSNIGTPGAVRCQLFSHDAGGSYKSKRSWKSFPPDDIVATGFDPTVEGGALRIPRTVLRDIGIVAV